MFDITSADHPFPYLLARLSGRVALADIDAAQPFTRFGSLFEPHATPRVVIVELEPDTEISIDAAGVMHYLLMRLLASDRADLRVVGPGRLQPLPLYYRAAVAAGKVRYADTLADAFADRLTAAGPVEVPAFSMAA